MPTIWQLEERIKYQIKLDWDFEKFLNKQNISFSWIVVNIWIKWIKLSQFLRLRWIQTASYLSCSVSRSCILVNVLSIEKNWYRIENCNLQNAFLIRLNLPQNINFDDILNSPELKVVKCLDISDKIDIKFEVDKILIEIFEKIIELKKKWFVLTYLCLNDELNLFRQIIKNFLNYWIRIDTIKDFWAINLYISKSYWVEDNIKVPLRYEVIQYLLSNLEFTKINLLKLFSKIKLIEEIKLISETLKK